MMMMVTAKTCIPCQLVDVEGTAVRVDMKRSILLCESRRQRWTSRTCSRARKEIYISKGIEGTIKMHTSTMRQPFKGLNSWNLKIMILLQVVWPPFTRKIWIVMVERRIESSWKVTLASSMKSIHKCMAAGTIHQMNFTSIEPENQRLGRQCVIAALSKDIEKIFPFDLIDSNISSV